MYMPGAGNGENLISASRASWVLWDARSRSVGGIPEGAGGSTCKRWRGGSFESLQRDGLLCAERVPFAYQIRPRGITREIQCRHK